MSEDYSKASEFTTVYGKELYVGSCGENTQWSLTDAGELVIKGSGRMQDYSHVIDMTGKTPIKKWDAPWCNYSDSITSVTVGESVTYIGKNAFRELKNLKTAQIGDAVEMIGAIAFSGCAELTRVSLGNHVSSIESYAFSGCKTLRDMNFPSSLKEIDKTAFQFCPLITVPKLSTAVKRIKSPGAVTVDGKPFEIELDVLEDGTLRVAKCDASLKDQMIGELKIADDIDGAIISEIGEAAFMGCKKLSAATLPTGLKVIGERAFYGCDCLKRVTFGKQLREIKQSAFSLCDSLEHVVLPEGLKRIKDDAFGGCHHLLSVKIPSSVDMIDDSAFKNCYRLAASVISGSKAQEYCENKSIQYFSGEDADTIAEKGAPASWLTECHLGQGFVLDVGPGTFLSGGKANNGSYIFQSIFTGSKITIADQNIKDYSDTHLSDEAIMRKILSEPGALGEKRPENLKIYEQKGMLWVAYDFQLNQMHFYSGVVVCNGYALKIYSGGGIMNPISTFVMYLSPTPADKAKPSASPSGTYTGNSNGAGHAAAHEEGNQGKKSLFQKIKELFIRK